MSPYMFLLARGLLARVLLARGQAFPCGGRKARAGTCPSDRLRAIKQGHWSTPEISAASTSSEEVRCWTCGIAVVTRSCGSSGL
jgi:hypothetical protein